MLLIVLLWTLLEPANPRIYLTRALGSPLDSCIPEVTCIVTRWSIRVGMQPDTHTLLLRMSVGCITQTGLLCAVRASVLFACHVIVRRSVPDYRLILFLDFVLFTSYCIAPSGSRVISE
jgi:hypothetical protein